MKERFLTGIKPTGLAHIGNYFGAIKPAIEMQKENPEADCFYFIADNHALTTLKTAEEMREYTYNIACTWLACGLDPDRVVFFRQSDVIEVFHLNWLLSCVTPKGLMNRAHAYKAIAEKNAEIGEEKDAGVNMGLYNYPILMAADILMYGTTKVPVGLDQKQHIEIASDIAKYFNNKYGEVFVEPKEYIDQNVCTILGLDGRKMSKSYNNTIQLFCSEKELQKSVNRIVTDSRLPGESKDPDCTLSKIYKLFATKEKHEEFRQKLINGLGWGDAKKELFTVMNDYIKPMREKYDYYMAHRSEVDAILSEGAKRAKLVASKLYNKALKKVGILK